MAVGAAQAAKPSAPSASWFRDLRRSYSADAFIHGPVNAVAEWLHSTFLR